MLIVINSNEEKSRNLITENYKVLDWAKDHTEIVEYVTKQYPQIQAFPAIVDLENNIIANDIESISEGLGKIINLQNIIKNRLKQEFYHARSGIFSRIDIFVNRHRRQKELNIQTTLTDEEYLILQNYAQSLCDIPNQVNFPETIIYPENPLKDKIIL